MGSMSRRRSFESVASGIEGCAADCRNCGLFFAAGVAGSVLRAVGVETVVAGESELHHE